MCSSDLQDPLGVDYKDCLITKKEHFSLPGVQKSFHSLRELTGFYQRNKLLLGEVPVKLERCCPPKSKGTAQQEKNGRKESSSIHLHSQCNITH